MATREPIPNQPSLAITGHRHLPSSESISLSIRSVLNTLAPYQPTLLSPLAEGADRLAAHEILRLSGASLHAILPLPKQDYQNDFSTPESRQDFEDLLAQAAKIETLPPQPDRPAAYQAIGRHLVDTCDILLAIWDGQISRGRGGTAEVVAYARQCQKPLIIIDSNNPTRVLFERMSELEDKTDTVNWETQCKAVSQEKVTAAIEENKTRYLDRLLDSCRDVKKDSAAAPCTELSRRLNEFLNHFLPAFTLADLSSNHHHKAYCRSSTAVFTLGALAVIIVAAQHLFHLPHLLVLGEIFCIGLILMLFHWGNYRRWHRTWVDCRYFAERVRCGLFVAFICGKSAVHKTSRWPDQLVDGAWCNPVFHDLMHDRPKAEPLRESHLEVLRHFMVNHWLLDQAEYHASISKRRMRQHKIVSRLGEAFFWMTLAVALLHLTSHDLRHVLHVDHILTDNLLTFIVIALPAMGTALAGLRGHFEFKKISTRSSMIELQLKSLISQAGKAENLADLSLAVLRAEELMIQENAGWHLHTSDKDVHMD